MGCSDGSGSGGSGTVLDALLKFITLEKLGVSISDIAKSVQEEESLASEKAMNSKSAPGAVNTVEAGPAKEDKKA